MRCLGQTCEGNVSLHPAPSFGLTPILPTESASPSPEHTQPEPSVDLQFASLDWGNSPLTLSFSSLVDISGSPKAMKLPKLASSGEDIEK